MLTLELAGSLHLHFSYVLGRRAIARDRERWNALCKPCTPALEEVRLSEVKYSLGRETILLRRYAPSSPANAEITNKWSYHSNSPICLHGVDRENVTLYVYFYSYFAEQSEQIGVRLVGVRLEF